MSATSQPATFSDLYTSLLNMMRSDTSATATISQAKRYLNTALQDVHLGQEYRFPWAERRAVIQTQNDYTTGTIAVTQGSATVTGSSTTWNTANAFGINNARTNGKMVFSGSRSPYVVKSVESDTSLTLTEKFSETTLAAGSSYTYFEDEYDLVVDFLRLVDMQRFSDEWEIPIISRTEFRRRFPANTIPGKPTVACLLDYAPVGTTAPVRRVRFASPPNDFLRIPYSYITSNLAVNENGVAGPAMIGDKDEPIIPLRYRHALVFHAAYHYYRDKKDDSRSQEMKGEYVDLMSRVMMDTEVGAPRPKLEPRITPYVRSAKTPWGRGAGARYDSGGRFDRGG